MSSAASIGLGLIAAALAGIIVMEWRAREAWDEPASHSVLALPPGERTQQVAEGTTDNSSQWIDAILARPLFTPDRRPPHQSHAEAAPTTAVVPPRLAGVLISPAGKAAIFAAGGPKPIVVREGGKLGEYTVQLIEAGRVTLRGPAGPIVLRPTFENGAKPTTALAPLHPGSAGGWSGIIVRNDHTQ